MAKAQTNTYYAARAFSIQSHDFNIGDVLGEGDVSKGKFQAADGLERIVECGHVVPRLADGRVVTADPNAKSKPADPSPDADKQEPQTE
jgi:hypothetical protein